ncbi:hypothetical protein C9374_012373 [Naegleria lovaniensis]|uniref:CRAL-TRIO domain-containing protein n=1 Tax=Naegleria lovaniensis TaxID=51637 RepID=A0AA88KQ43_NAELO|nr:uncharacterized protein C9374_012373 [Naegleria lovaniensis]KAG2392121.1 hypothetical protein C9374_012373 [Naegleria lovaniensis]
MLRLKSESSTSGPGYQLMDFPELEKVRSLHKTYTKDVTQEQLDLMDGVLVLLVRVLVQDGEAIVAESTVSESSSDDASSNNHTSSVVRVAKALKATREIPQVVKQEKNTLKSMSAEEFNELRRKLLDDFAIYRYLRGHAWALDESTRLIIKMLNWRHEYKPENVRFEEFLDTTAKSKMFIDTGYASDNGMPLFYMWVSRDLLDNSDENKSLKFRHLIYVHERNFIREGRFKDDNFQMNWVVDVSGISLNLVRRMKDIFDDIGFYYPERLGRVFVINAPWTINLIWAFLSPFLSEELKAKYMMIKMDELKNKIDPDSLPTEFGGNLQIDWDAYYSKLMKEDKERVGEQK